MVNLITIKKLSIYKLLWPRLIEGCVPVRKWLWNGYGGGYGDGDGNGRGYGGNGYGGGYGYGRGSGAGRNYGKST